ncbi:uncharacterized protein LOC123905364 [Trifolium pratense]|uniref:uncharacterized protein LOC123905364 n=1 Tax=Trifolium pratense TaxID=57577 RepID=UPI001E6907CC|nr:uncharacterized protein LOC123905364 [Trifolium pratense]
MAEQRTLRQLAAPDVNYNGLCIEYAEVDVPFELKSGLIHLLPRFNGLAGEDPHKHLKEFQVVCSTPLRPEGITEDHIKLRAFPFSLQGAAKDWLYYLEPISVSTWNDLKKVFLERYFPASRAASIRKEICGLLPMDRNILDAASGGALVDKTPAAAKALIENMSLNSQQFTTRNNSASVNEIQSSSSSIKALETKFDARIDELTSLVKKLAVSKAQPAKVCGICTSSEHPTDTCPILQDETITELPQAYAAAAALYNQNRYNNPDLSTNKYHPSWRNHQNLQYGNQSQAAAPAAPPATSSLEDLVKQLAQRTDASIQNLTTQMGQMANAIGQLQAQGSGNLPAQTVPNPNVNVSAITLRSGRVSEPAPEKKKKKTVASSSAPEPPSVTIETEPEKERVYVPPIPFPQRVQKNIKKTVEEDKEILDVFRKCAVNIPLIDAIKQIPKYAKFLKDLCTHKRKLKENERISLGRNVSAFIQPKTGSSANVSVISQTMPEKCDDPGVFAIPCSIGDRKFENCMLDLGAGINVMPTSIYNNLDLGPLQPTGLIVQLANRSNARPAGKVEDVLVQVNDLILPADFYILDMEGETNSSRAPIILGRPFMRTARTKVDVYDGTMSMEFGDIVAKFNIFDDMKHPVEEHSVFYMDLVTNTNLCSVCAKIESDLQDNNIHTGEVVVNEAVCTVKVLDIPAAPTKHSHDKEKTTHFHDKMISKKKFFVCQKVLLFKSRLKDMVGKFRSKWIGPFVVTNVFPSGAIEIKSTGSSSSSRQSSIDDVLHEIRAQNALNQERDGLFYAMHQQQEEMMERMTFMQAQQDEILQNQHEMQGYYHRWESSEEHRQQQLDNVIQELGGLRLQFNNFQNYQHPPS